MTCIIAPYGLSLFEMVYHTICNRQVLLGFLKHYYFSYSYVVKCFFWYLCPSAAGVVVYDARYSMRGGSYVSISGTFKQEYTHLLICIA